MTCFLPPPSFSIALRTVEEHEMTTTSKSKVWWGNAHGLTAEWMQCMVTVAGRIGCVTCCVCAGCEDGSLASASALDLGLCFGLGFWNADGRMQKCACLTRGGAACCFLGLLLVGVAWACVGMLVDWLFGK